MMPNKRFECDLRVAALPSAPQAQRSFHMKNAVALATICLLQGCSSHTYHAEGMKIADVAYETLIGQGVCQSLAQCRKEARVFFESGSWGIGSFSYGGVHLNIYGVSSLQIAEKLAAAVRSVHASMPGVPVTLSVFSTPHLESKFLLKSYSFK